MQSFSLVIRILSPIPVLVGLSHLILGLGADLLLGAQLPEDVISDPVLDSQNRFYGVVFMGFGALLFVCSSDVVKYATVLRITLGFVLLGGVARVISIVLFGLPTPLVSGLILVELIGVPLLLIWHAKVLRQNQSG